jgi:Tfp pilus assembly pilus retraction ATPase PilT
MIRDDKAHLIPNAIQTGANDQMRTMNQALYELYRQGKVTYDTALRHSLDPDDLRRQFRRTM